jgi:hypothetical protein
MSQYNERTFPKQWDLEFFTDSHDVFALKLMTVDEMLQRDHAGFVEGVVLAHYKQPRSLEARVDVGRIDEIEARLTTIRTTQMTHAEIDRFVQNFAREGQEHVDTMRKAARRFLTTGYTDTVRFQVLGDSQLTAVAARKLNTKGGSNRVGVLTLQVLGVDDADVWRQMCAMYDLSELMRLPEFVRFVARME